MSKEIELLKEAIKILEEREKASNVLLLKSKEALISEKKLDFLLKI